MSAPTLPQTIVTKMHQRIGLEPWEQSVARSIIATEVSPLFNLAQEYARTLIWIKRNAPAGWCQAFEGGLERVAEVLGEPVELESEEPA